jgi:cytoskeletal protein CcmA (bactofilin family)
MKRYPKGSARLLLVIVLALAALLFSSATTWAAEPRGGEQIVIGANEIIDDDLYVAANTLTVDGTIKGDLVAAAQQITINGRVEGDVLVGAQTVVVSGQIGDDLRVAGEAVMLTPSARIGGDLAAGAASIEQQVGSVIGGDVLAGAYQALLAGTIERDVRAGFNRAELRGTIGGDAALTIDGSPAGSGALTYRPSGQLRVPDVHAGLTMADTAHVSGKLTYSTYTDATISPAARVEGGINASRLPPAATTAPTSVPGLPYLQRFAALLLVGLLLLWLAPGWLRHLGETLSLRPLPSFGWGAVAAITLIATALGVLVTTVLLALLFGFLTLGGIAALIVSVGVLLELLLSVGFITFAAYGAAVIVSLVVGRWLVALARPAWVEQPIVPLLVGLVAYSALRAIPVLGPIIALVVVLLALGALWEWASAAIRRPRPNAPPINTLQPV